MLDIEKIRQEFPILASQVGGKPLVYLDNTATSQTPRRVVDEIERMYCTEKANVHRGVHTLSQLATEAQERTREAVRRHINAASVEEVIFTRGTTEAINLVASSFGQLFENGDEIILTVMEHHSNIVPWQLLGRRKRVLLRVVPITKDGSLNLEAYRSLFNERTRLVAFCHVSNVLGTVNPVKEMVVEAHSRGVPVLVDGAQASPHMRIDVRDLDVDFYAFSSHKMYGPTGIGILYGKKRWLTVMPPYQGGGEMIGHVSFEGTTWAELPFKFEAGTPDFVGIAAFAKAFEFIAELGIDKIEDHEMRLAEYAAERMRAAIPDIEIYGNAPGKGPVISFNVPGVHHYDLGLLLDKMGVAVRTGHHCAQPLMQALGIEGCVRASFAVYNTRAEADAFIASLTRAAAMLR
ncbi:MAG: cysteine desulfurase [Muribaculaceae bacterium]|nr:cysteine desulfurase [Muribaculaceae bacterium]